MWESWLIVIPARLASTRLPEKPLADLGGKPLVVRVYERLLPLIKEGAEVVVATDSEKIIRVCDQWQVKAVMTGEHHTSGTSRCAEVASRSTKKYVMNIQGDEPFINSEDIRALANAMQRDPHPEMATLVYESANEADFQTPNVVKTLRDKAGYAIYFSRSPIPHHRSDQSRFKNFLQHMGVYAFQKKALEQFVAWAPTELEACESLEQLRALYNGMKIYLVNAKNSSIGIDTPEDLKHARQKF